MSRRVLLCEGQEDLAALREILERIHQFNKESLTGQSKQERRRRGQLVIDLIVAGDRGRVALTALQLLANDSPADPIERLGLCFDPNGDDEPAWRSWLEKQFHSANRDSFGYLLHRASLPPIAIDPLPWIWPPATCYGLDRSDCLERIAVELLAAVAPDHHHRIDRWMAELGGEQPTWKTAARLWNALVFSDVSGPGFYSKVFGQHAPTQQLLARRIAATPFGIGMDAFLSAPR